MERQTPLSAGTQQYSSPWQAMTCGPALKRCLDLAVFSLLLARSWFLKLRLAGQMQSTFSLQGLWLLF